MQTADRVRLEHILEACQKVDELIEGYSRTGFEDDYRTYAAVIKTIEMIGESANKISLEFKEQHPEIPWRRMVSTRNRLIHVYWAIDFDILWTIATAQIPILREQISLLLISE